MYCKINLPLTPSERGKASECSQLGMWDALKKIKIVYQSEKYPLSNSLRITNYLIPPLEEVVRARFLNINKLQNLQNLNKYLLDMEITTTDYVTITDTILDYLRQQEVEAVAACDYEEKLRKQ